ncbi:MAG: pyrimidine/purine nucleoside phosphorylase [Pseudomonadota bacterium]|nr:pyrimidine/purine nucleoside phosphorylase [Pseudomonadota bacterium]
MERFDNVNVLTRANIYFEGKCISHTIEFPDGSKKTLGVIFPSCLTFQTNAPERMEILDGQCRIRVGHGNSYTYYQAGESFNIPENSSFDIETIETLSYICHFG